MQSQSPDHRERLQQLSRLLKAATEDNAVCTRYIDAEDSPFWRRSTYRTAFSSIEALTSHVKQSALLFAEGTNGLFSEAEILALRELEYGVEDDGQIVCRKAKHRFLPSICFALRAFAKSVDNPYRVEKDAGWDALTKSVRVRDRITHPKTAEDFAITDSEMRHLAEAWAWFGKALVTVSSHEMANQSPEATPGQRPPLPPSPSSGAPQL